MKKIFTLLCLSLAIVGCRADDYVAQDVSEYAVIATPFPGNPDYMVIHMEIPLSRKDTIDAYFSSPKTVSSSGWDDTLRKFNTKKVEVANFEEFLQKTTHTFYFQFDPRKTFVSRASCSTQGEHSKVFCLALFKKEKILSTLDKSPRIKMVGEYLIERGDTSLPVELSTPSISFHQDTVDGWETVAASPAVPNDEIIDTPVLSSGDETPVSANEPLDESVENEQVEAEVAPEPMPIHEEMPLVNCSTKSVFDIVASGAISDGDCIQKTAETEELNLNSESSAGIASGGSCTLSSGSTQHKLGATLLMLVSLLILMRKRET